jgi:hypothetical protein
MIMTPYAIPARNLCDRYAFKTGLSVVMSSASPLKFFCVRY